MVKNKLKLSLARTQAELEELPPGQWEATGDIWGGKWCNHVCYKIENTVEEMTALEKKDQQQRWPDQMKDGSPDRGSGSGVITGEEHAV